MLLQVIHIKVKFSFICCLTLSIDKQFNYTHIYVMTLKDTLSICKIPVKCYWVGWRQTYHFMSSNDVTYLLNCFRLLKYINGVLQSKWVKCNIVEVVEYPDSTSYSIVKRFSSDCLKILNKEICLGKEIRHKTQMEIVFDSCSSFSHYWQLNYTKSIKWFFCLWINKHFLGGLCARVFGSICMSVLNCCIHT